MDVLEEAMLLADVQLTDWRNNAHNKSFERIARQVCLSSPLRAFFEVVGIRAGSRLIRALSATAFREIGLIMNASKFRRSERRDDAN